MSGVSWAAFCTLAGRARAGDSSALRLAARPRPVGADAGGVGAAAPEAALLRLGVALVADAGLTVSRGGSSTSGAGASGIRVKNAG